jgi:hypothetical protein
VHFFHWTALMKITAVCSDGDLCHDRTWPYWHNVRSETDHYPCYQGQTFFVTSWLNPSDAPQENSCLYIMTRFVTAKHANGTWPETIQQANCSHSAYFPQFFGYSFDSPKCPRGTSRPTLTMQVVLIWDNSLDENYFYKHQLLIGSSCWHLLTVTQHCVLHVSCY